MSSSRATCLAVVLAAAAPVVAGAADVAAMSAHANAVVSDGVAMTIYRAQLEEVLAEVAPASSPRSSTTDGTRGSSQCVLMQTERQGAEAGECLKCHGLHRTHPVDVDYDVSYSRGRRNLRAVEEVVRRGVFLPDGKVRCATCHEARSQWKYRLAIPPGAMVRTAVSPRDASTYEVRPVAQAASSMPAGAAVSPTPLCMACHAYD